MDVIEPGDYGDGTAGGLIELRFKWLEKVEEMPEAEIFLWDYWSGSEGVDFFRVFIINFFKDYFLV